MISTELANLSDWVIGHANKKLPLTPVALAHLARVLLDLSHQAKQLEALPCDTKALHDAA